MRLFFLHIHAGVRYLHCESPCSVVIFLPVLVNQLLE